MKLVEGGVHFVTSSLIFANPEKGGEGANRQVEHNKQLSLYYYPHKRSYRKVMFHRCPQGRGAGTIPPRTVPHWDRTTLESYPGTVPPWTVRSIMKSNFLLKLDSNRSPSFFILIQNLM